MCVRAHVRACASAFTGGSGRPSWLRLALILAHAHAARPLTAPHTPCAQPLAAGDAPAAADDASAPASAPKRQRKQQQPAAAAAGDGLDARQEPAKRGKAPAANGRRRSAGSGCEAEVEGEDE